MSVRLPVGPKPRFEEELPVITSPRPRSESRSDNGEDDGPKATPPLKSIEESLVLLQSIRQSRTKWLTSGFVKFWTRPRTKSAEEIPQPPHELYVLGKSDIVIGPHIYLETRFFEARYKSPVYLHQPTGASTSSSSIPSTLPPNARLPNGQLPPPFDSSNRQQPSQSHYTSVFSASPSTPSTPQPSMSQAPPTASTAAAAIPYPLPPDLLNRVNAEAKNNPALQDALNLAADGKANQEQLLLLGKFIQNLPPTQQGTNTPTTHANKSSSYSTQHPSASTPTPAYTSSPATYDPNHPYKRADIIFEFRENTVDRWILPLDNILIEKIYRRSTAVVFDILISTFAPFDTLNNTVLTPQIASRMKNTTLHPLTFRLTAVSPVLWDAIGRRAKLGDLELVSQTQAVFKELLKHATSRTFLQNRISEGSMLKELAELTAEKHAPKIVSLVDKAAQRETTSQSNPSKRVRTRDDPSKAAQAGVDGAPPKPKRIRPTKPKQICSVCKEPTVSSRTKPKEIAPGVEGPLICRACLRQAQQDRNAQKAQQAQANKYVPRLTVEVLVPPPPRNFSMYKPPQPVASTSASAQTASSSSSYRPPPTQYGTYASYYPATGARPASGAAGAGTSYPSSSATYSYNPYVQPTTYYPQASQGHSQTSQQGYSQTQSSAASGSGSGSNTQPSAYPQPQPAHTSYYAPSSSAQRSTSTSQSHETAAESRARRESKSVAKPSAETSSKS